MKRATTISREKSTDGGGGGALGARMWRLQSAVHSFWLRTTIWVGWPTPLASPVAKVENGTVTATAAPAVHEASSSTKLATQRIPCIHCRVRGPRSVWNGW